VCVFQLLLSVETYPFVGRRCDPIPTPCLMSRLLVADDSQSVRARTSRSGPPPHTPHKLASHSLLAAHRRSHKPEHSVVLSIKQHVRSLADPNTVPVYTPVPIKDCRQATPAPSGPTVPRLLQAPAHKPSARRPRPSRRQLYNFTFNVFVRH
jgi:hypothetical protein